MQPLPYFGSTVLWAVAWPGGSSPVRFRENEHYQKRSQRNRTRIATSHGPLALSVPLVAGKHEACPVAEVRIRYEPDWRRKHWLSLRAAYGSAPFWPEYAPELEALYALRPDRLWDWSWGIATWVARELGAGPVLAEALPQSSDAMLREVVDYRPRPELPAYPQVFTERTGWLGNLSVVDALLCLGPETPAYLAHLREHL